LLLPILPTDQSSIRIDVFRVFALLGKQNTFVSKDRQHKITKIQQIERKQQNGKLADAVERSANSNSNSGVVGGFILVLVLVSVVTQGRHDDDDDHDFGIGPARRSLATRTEIRVLAAPRR